ncbi:type IV secretory system conjugative DNA transfer family protein [Pseudoalteromonas prydzensis]|uniref:type IV secretory system conjugative DNA transfer family protein n=1 Tax=Pseudoalteromonas prydzensis TaxID=182141 RepID=UPI003FD3474B
MRELKNTFQRWHTIALCTLMLTLPSYFFLLKYTWSIGINWGTLSHHIGLAKLIVRDLLNIDTSSFYQYQNYLIENDLTYQWVLHLLIPLLISLAASSFIAFKLLWVKGGCDTAIHISGSRLYKDKFAVKHAKKTLKKELKNNPSIGLNIHPNIAITELQEVGNILIEGAQSSGKSTIIKPIVKNISKTSSPMLIYDAKREYTEILLSKDTLLLSPTDERSLCWDIAADSNSPEMAYEIASCFIIESEKDAIWGKGARLILAGCMVSLGEIKPNWTWYDLNKMLDKPTYELSILFEKYYPKAAKLLSEDSKTTDSFIMELTTQMSWLDTIAKVWKEDHKYKFSVTDWAQGKYNFSSLIIPNDPKYSSISAPLCTAVLTLIVSEVLALPDNKNKFWFILDEIADLPKTKALEKWLSLGRSKGARTIAGTQNISQIQSIYGDKNAETLTSLFSNIVTLKVGSSVSAKKSAENLGKRIVKRATISFDKEGSRSTSYQQSEEYIVRAEDIMQLPSPSKRGISGYLSISSWNAVYKLVWPYPEIDIIAEAYIPISLANNINSTTTSKRGSRGRSRSC